MPQGHPFSGVERFPSMRSDHGLQTQLTNWKTYFAAALFGGLGALLITIAEGLDAIPTAQTVLRNIGSFLMATILPALLWELVAKRNLLKEVERQINLPPAAHSSGLLETGVSRSWLEVTTWGTPKTIDLLLGLCEIPRWDGRHGEIVRRLIDRARCTGGRMRVAIPNPESHAILELLCIGLGRAVEERHLDEISQELTAFKDALVAEKPTHDEAGWGVDVYYLATLPRFGYLRVDDKAIVALDTHQSFARTGGGPLVFTLAEGDLLRFFASEFDTLTGDARLRTAIRR